MKDSVTLIIERLKASLPEGKFKTFYAGDPDLIPEFNLPCIVVELMDSRTEGGSTAERDVTDTVLVKVIYNKKDDWTGTIDPLNSTHRNLLDAVNKTDDNNTYLPDTLYGALLEPLNGDMRINRDSVLELGTLPRPENIVTAEAHLTLNVLHTVRVEQSI